MWCLGSAEVGVQLVNRSTQNYEAPKAPPPKYDFKASAGQSMVAGGSAAAGSGASAFAGATPKLHVCNEAEPTTDIQLVTADRKKTKVKFNQTATVMEVYQHMAALSKINKFELIGGGGIPKPLTNPSATLKDANLLNSSFSQRVPAAAGTAAAGGGAARAGAKK